MHDERLAQNMVMAYALTPRDMATSVRSKVITDGPFVDFQGDREAGA